MVEGLQIKTYAISVENSYVNYVERDYLEDIAQYVEDLYVILIANKLVLLECVENV